MFTARDGLQDDRAAPERVGARQMERTRRAQVADALLGVEVILDEERRFLPSFANRRALV